MRRDENTVPKIPINRMTSVFKSDYLGFSSSVELLL